MALHVSYFAVGPATQVWGDATLSEFSRPRCAEEVEHLRAELLSHARRGFPESKITDVVIIAWSALDD